jgi:hypothetical protein
MGWNGVVREKWDSNLLEDGLIGDGVRGALYGDMSQLWAQLLSACVCATFAFVMGYVWFKFSNLITPLRVPADVEMQGLDIPEMGVPGYPDFMPAPHSLSSMDQRQRDSRRIFSKECGGSARRADSLRILASSQRPGKDAHRLGSKRCGPSRGFPLTTRCDGRE